MSWIDITRALALIVVLATFPRTAVAQQQPKSGYEPVVANPAYPLGKGPRVGVDASHHNFHTVDGRYGAFAQLLRADGFRVDAYDQPLTTRDGLAGIDILVIANALSEENAAQWSRPVMPAFTREEALALREWVSDGGALLLIVDHMPMPGCARPVAEAFGLQFSDGFAMPPGHNGPLVFSRDDESLGAHAITLGRGDDDAVRVVASFTGSAFLAGPGLTPLLILPPTTMSYLPQQAGQFDAGMPRADVSGWLQGAAGPIGDGRLVVFGEAAMFTAQEVTIDGEIQGIGFVEPEARDNQQLLLNVCRWLAGTRR